MIEDSEQQFTGSSRRANRSRDSRIWLPDGAQNDEFEINPNGNLPVAHRHQLIVFGGSFDPVHNGHIQLASRVLELGLGDEVRFIPAALSPLKEHSPAASGADRLAMLNGAVADFLSARHTYKRTVQSGAPVLSQKVDAVTGELVVNVHTGEKVMVEKIPTVEVEREYDFSVSDLELQRNRKSYTIETLNTLKRACPDCEISFMVGSDCLEEIEKWHRVGELLQQFRIIVYPRPGSRFCPHDKGDVDRMIPLLTEKVGSRFAIMLSRAMLTEEQCPVNDVSSSELRAAMACGGDLSAYLPPAVWEYIREHNLYSSQE